MGPGGVVWGKNRIQKISWDCPFKRNILFGCCYRYLPAWTFDPNYICLYLDTVYCGNLRIDHLFYLTGRVSCAPYRRDWCLAVAPAAVATLPPPPPAAVGCGGQLLCCCCCCHSCCGPAPAAAAAAGGETSCRGWFGLSWTLKGQFN